MAIPHFVLLPSTEEPPNFSGYVELRFPTCGRWDLSRNHTCYSTFSFSLLKTMMWLVSSKIEMRAIPLETDGQGCRRNKGPCMTSQSRTTTSGLVITSDYCEREENIFYISLSGNLYGNQFTIWLITRPMRKSGRVSGSDSRREKRKQWGRAWESNWCAEHLCFVLL